MSYIGVMGMVSKIVMKYYNESKREDSYKFKSWEYCYNYFRNCDNWQGEDEKEQAALHIAFYLASWGMCRGSSICLENDYKTHKYAVDLLLSSRYKSLWNMNLNNIQEFEGSLQSLLELKDELIKVYSEDEELFKWKGEKAREVENVVSKILLGTIGCAPSHDRYFICGKKYHGFKGDKFNEESIKELISFYHLFKEEFDKLSRHTKKKGLEYPIMKLIDMYFWQIGYMLDNSQVTDEDIEAIGYCISKCRVRQWDASLASL
jgi:hypothetical protein